MRRRFTVFAAVLAVSALAIASCGGDEASSGGLQLADRWLRVGEEISTNVGVYDRALPPDLSELLNPEIVQNGPASDPVALPVHPQAVLLGSYHLRRSDGTNLLWLIYDVDGDSAEVAKTIGQQLDQSPWQVVGGQANEALSVVRFQNTRSGDLDGSAVVQENPSSSDFRLTVVRAGKEVALTVPRSAPVPLLAAKLGTDLAVTRVDSGPEHSAGLQVGDRISRVNDTAVTSQQTLDAALHALATSGQRRSSVTYVVQIRPPVAPEASTFVVPLTPPQLPAAFPAQEAWQGLTVLDFVWGAQQGGKTYQATLISKDGSGTVTSRVRDGLTAAGWEITADAAAGFATELTIANPGSGQSGQVSIDAFPTDSAYVQVVVQIQSAGAGGN